MYNEEAFIEKCLDSLMAQSIDINQIIVVDDGSTDSSPRIVSKFDVTMVTRIRNEEKSLKRYPHVIREGSLLLDEFDYLGILDADTVLEPEYYEKLISKLQEDEMIGIAGGKLIGEPSTWLVLGLLPAVYGCNRLYTRKCWLDINDGTKMKFVPALDTYHNIYSRKFGYNPTRFEDVESWTLRPERTSTPFEKGFCSYQLGYHSFFLLGRAVKERASSMLHGYLVAWFKGEMQYPVKPIVREMQTSRVKKVITKWLPRARVIGEMV